MKIHSFYFAGFRSSRQSVLRMENSICSSTFVCTVSRSHTAMVSREPKVLIHQKKERRSNYKRYYCCALTCDAFMTQSLLLFLALVRLRGTTDIDDELQAMKV